MKIIKSIIKPILLIAITSSTMVAISSTTRVSCEGNMEKSNVPKRAWMTKKVLKVI